MTELLKGINKKGPSLFSSHSLRKLQISKKGPSSFSSHSLRKLQISKKGQFDVARKTIFWMLAGVMITIVIFVFALILGGHKANLMSVPLDVKAELISLRFTNSPECFAYQDNVSKVVFPGIIDLEKFNKTTLERCYSTEGIGGIKTLNFRLELQNTNLKLLTDNYYSADVTDSTIFKEVLVKYENGLEKDTLAIYVQEKIKGYEQ